jgi:GTP-binding protein
MINQSSNFIDYVRIFCKSGNGGKGSTHLRREKYIPKGGPDGGDGGRGGHIILRGDKQLWTLIHLKYRKHIKAENGGDGSGQLRTGADGKDIILKVPLGTVAKDGETGEVLFEIVDDGQEMILAGGGRGGLGNANFKSSTNQTPRYAQPGEEGIEGWFVLELKILADVGLVGFPNAGKSTLLSVVSAAKPKIADYAFTTLEPNLGIVNYYDDKSFVMADIPGIIEGAHEGRGLGLRFLRHIERNSMLLFMIPADSKDIAEEYGILLNELKQYNPELLGKERLLAVTKSDMLDDELKKETKKHLPKNIQYIFISSLTGEGIPQLKDMLWKTLNADGEIDRT